LTEAQEAEVRELRDTSYQTRRATAPGLEEILYEPIPVLDHGFVRVVDYMGDDGAIVQAARVSYGKGTKQTRGDTGLIHYLLRHRHTTPFEMCEIKYHIKLPIFVARQWIRHRTANVNEYSARYSILDNEFYIPAPEHLAAQSSVNRQGRGETLEGAAAERVLELLKTDSAQTYAHYEEMLNERPDGTVIDEGRAGLARELARMNLPLNIYTQWYWKIDLHNLMHRHVAALGAGHLRGLRELRGGGRSAVGRRPRGGAPAAGRRADQPGGVRAIQARVARIDGHARPGGPGRPGRPQRTLENPQRLLHDDTGRLAHGAAGIRDLVANSLGNGDEGLGVGAVGLGHHDRPSAVRGLADLDVERHLAQELDAQLLGLEPRPAVAEDVGLVATVRAHEEAHVLDDAACSR
jgi:thymidylate synthase (FAD)